MILEHFLQHFPNSLLVLVVSRIDILVHHRCVDIARLPVIDACDVRSWTHRPLREIANIPLNSPVLRSNSRSIRSMPFWEMDLRSSSEWWLSLSYKHGQLPRWSACNRFTYLPWLRDTQILGLGSKSRYHDGDPEAVEKSRTKHKLQQCVWNR